MLSKIQKLDHLHGLTSDFLYLIEKKYKSKKYKKHNEKFDQYNQP